MQDTRIERAYQNENMASFSISRTHTKYLTTSEALPKPAGSISTFTDKRPPDLAIGQPERRPSVVLTAPSGVRGSSDYSYSLPDLGRAGGGSNNPQFSDMLPGPAAPGAPARGGGVRSER